MKIIARTFMPFDNHVNDKGETCLSPTTDKSVMPFNNVITIQDILLDGKKYVLPGGGGSWSKGEDKETPSYKSKGEDYKYQEQYLEFLRTKKDHRIHDKFVNSNPAPEEKWQVITDGGTITFPSFSLAQQFKEKSKSKGLQKAYIRKLAQSIKVTVIADSMRKTFAVESTDYNKGSQETGTAFCVAPNYFLTCAHVISKYDKNNIASVSNFGQGQKIRLVQEGRFYNAELVHFKLEWDIALLRADVDSEPFIISPSVNVGEDILVIGSPYGYESNVVDGILGSLDRKIYNYKDAPLYMFIDASVHPGNSGGPVIRQDDGTIVGLITLILSQSGFYGLNAALQSQNINKFLKETRLF